MTNYRAVGTESVLVSTGAVLGRVSTYTISANTTMASTPSQTRVKLRGAGGFVMASSCQVRCSSLEYYYAFIFFALARTNA